MEVKETELVFKRRATPKFTQDGVKYKSKAGKKRRQMQNEFKHLNSINN